MSKSSREIQNLLAKRDEEGVPQTELVDQLSFSRSTISESLTRLEDERKIVRRNMNDKSKRVWRIQDAPFPLDNLIRVGLLRTVEYPHALLTIDDIYPNTRINIFNSAMEATRSLSKGQVDIAFSPLTTQAMFSSLMKSIRIVAGAGYEGSGIIYREGSDLQNIEYGCSELSTMETYLKKFLESKSIDPIDVEISYFKNPERMVEAYINEEVDGLSIWEPYFSNLKSDSRSEFIEFSEIFGRYPCCTVGINTEFQKKNEELFKKFINKYFENTEKLKNHYNDLRSRAIDLTVDKMGFNRETVLTTFDKYDHDFILTEESFVNSLKRFGLKPTEQFLSKVLDLSYIDARRKDE